MGCIKWPGDVVEIELPGHFIFIHLKGVESLSNLFWWWKEIMQEVPFAILYHRDNISCLFHFWFSRNHAWLRKIASELSQSIRSPSAEVYKHITKCNITDSSIDIWKWEKRILCVTSALMLGDNSDAIFLNRAWFLLNQLSYKNEILSVI